MNNRSRLIASLSLIAVSVLLVVPNPVRAGVGAVLNEGGAQPAGQGGQRVEAADRVSGSVHAAIGGIIDAEGLKQGHVVDRSAGSVYASTWNPRRGFQDAAESVYVKSPGE